MRPSWYAAEIGQHRKAQRRHLLTRKLATAEDMLRTRQVNLLHYGKAKC